MAKKQNTQNKELKLEDILFNCRDILRGKIGLSNKRDILLTLTFLKFLDEKFQKRRGEIINDLKNNQGITDERFINMQLENPSSYFDSFYLPEDCRFSYFIDKVEQKDLPVTIDNAVSTLMNQNERLKGSLPSKLMVDSRIEPKVLAQLLDEINKISSEKFQEKDLIGHVYEYFLRTFAVSMKDDKEEGEFYTPQSIVELIAAMIEPMDGSVYDPCCGSGGMFVQSVKFVEAHGGNTRAVQVFGQESNPETYRLARMNLAVRGISNDLGGQNASTFTNDLHKTRKMDYVMANPPFNLKKWRTEEELKDDPRWAGYATPPVSNANYAWILHILNKLEPTNGIAGFLLANGALSDEDTISIRQKLIENDKIEAIIILPRNMFYSTDISVTLWILNQNKKERVWHNRKQRDRSYEILFMDLRKWDDNIYEKKYVQFSKEQIDKVVSVYQNWQSPNCDGTNYAEPEFYRSVGTYEIEKNGWSLVPSRYIEFVDQDKYLDYESIIKESKKEIQQLLEEQKNDIKELENALLEIDTNDNISNYAIALKDILTIVNNTNSKGYDYPFMGVNIDKDFVPTVANISNVDKRKYNVIKKGQFVFSGMQTGRDKCIRFSLYNNDTPALLSPAYTILEVKNENVLPEYLFINFLSKEKDRLGWFYSDGSVRANLDIQRFLEIKIPVPSIEVQNTMVSVYKNLNSITSISQKSKGIIGKLCPALVQYAKHIN